MPRLEEIRLLLARATLRRFILLLLGTILAALADAAGVFAMLPLMQLLTGSPRDEGVLGYLSALFGQPEEQVFAIALAGLAFGAFAVKGVLALVFKWWLLGFMSKQESETAERLLAYYLKAPYELHLQSNSAEMLRAINDAVRSVFTQQVMVNFVNVMSELFTILAVAITLIVVIPIPALLLLVYFAATGALLYGVIRPMTQRAGERMLASYTEIYRAALQALGGVKEIKVRRKHSFFLQTFREARATFAESQRSASFFGELPRYVLEFLFILGIGLMTVFVFVTSPSAQAISTLTIVAAAGFRLLPSAVRLVSSMNVIRFGRPSLELVLSELRKAAAMEHALPQAASSTDTPHDRFQLHDEIEFEDVSFTYPGQPEPAVQDVSFRVPVGTAVALVGSSGAGKSTMVDLLLGLHAPVRGRITADHEDIASMLPAWQASVGFVPQEVFLLDATLKQNIAFGHRDEDIDDEQLAQAVAAAQLGELVASLPLGLDTPVGERGARLSGGERQRVGIARALYSRPELLVMDEATSALDNETERRVSETIAKLRGRMTIIIVAHRLSTVRDCDEIVFLADGRVSARGTFSDLQDVSDEFARLVELGRLT
jgi:ABC-type multidrug transport system fused ATPase/permease subunit